MPTRRTMELVVITVVLLAPALSLVNLWFKRVIATTPSPAVADAAKVGANLT